MIDNEIIKALECCTSDEVGMCHICPLDGGCNGDITILLNCSLDLINSQKAEIERLKNNVFCKVVINEETMRSIIDEKVAGFELDIASIKAEAIKESLDKVAVFCAESGLFHCEADEMLLFNYLDSLKMQAMLKANGMAGDAE